MCDIVDYLYIVDYLLYVYKLIINYLFINCCYLPILSNVVDIIWIIWINIYVYK